MLNCCYLKKKKNLILPTLLVIWVLKLEQQVTLYLEMSHQPLRIFEWWCTKQSQSSGKKKLRKIWKYRSIYKNSVYFSSHRFITQIPKETGISHLHQLPCIPQLPPVCWWAAWTCWSVGGNLQPQSCASHIWDQGLKSHSQKHKDGVTPQANPASSTWPFWDNGWKEVARTKDKVCEWLKHI